MRFNIKEIQVFIFDAGQLPLRSHSQIVLEYGTRIDRTIRNRSYNRTLKPIE